MYKISREVKGWVLPISVYNKSSVCLDQRALLELVSINTYNNLENSS